MNNLKIKVLSVYIILLVVFGIFLVPMNEETGVFREDVVSIIVEERTFALKPIWSQSYLTENKSGNVIVLVYTITAINKITYVSFLMLITLACGASYIAFKKT
ncbi:MAG: hypothetical protein ACLKAK_12585 [Alkaliphilus sp.]